MFIGIKAVSATNQEHYVSQPVNLLVLAVIMLFYDLYVMSVRLLTYYLAISLKGYSYNTLSTSQP